MYGVGEAKTETSAKSLKQNATGLVDALVIEPASTAPAYSLVAGVGLVVRLDPHFARTTADLRDARPLGANVEKERP